MRHILEPKFGRREWSHAALEARGHPRHCTNPRAHRPSPASVIRASNQNTCLHDGYAGTVNKSCRHKLYPTCLIPLCLQTRGAARVQYFGRYVIMASDVRGQCIYSKVRHRVELSEQDFDHLSRQRGWLLNYLFPLIFCTTFNAPLRTALSQSISTLLPIKTTFKLHTKLLLLRLPSDSSTNKTATITHSLRLRHRHLIAATPCAGSP